jgi:hypothetical protein
LLALPADSHFLISYLKRSMWLQEIQKRMILLEVEATIILEENSVGNMIWLPERTIFPEKQTRVANPEKPLL